MMIKCLAVDDEPMALEKLVNYISKIPFLELVGACSCSYEAMQQMAEKKVDAIFIDINMPDQNGMDFIKSLPESPLVVFTTAYAEYAVDSYKVRAVDYLLKPYTFSDFQRSAAYLMQQMEAKEQSNMVKGGDYIFLKVDYRYVRVAFDDMLYIEGMNEYLKIYLKSGDPILVHTTFKQLNNHLPENFLQVHRSYVVNMNHVLEVERSLVLLEGGKRISISESNKEAFLAYLGKRIVKR